MLLTLLYFLVLGEEIWKHQKVFYRIGGQEHFYLETQACLAVPKGEDGEMEIFASTQNPSNLQAEVNGIYSRLPPYKNIKN